VKAVKADDFKILIVDDDPLMRDFLRAFCEVNNYQAEFAADGREALGLLEEEGDYSLAIVDFLMPEMHGIDLIRQIRRKWKHISIIAMSAWDDIKKSFIDAGASLFLEKPFDPYVLEKQIEAIRNEGVAAFLDHL
jgi:DNA-binding response OmpR family regulator